MGLPDSQPGELSFNALILPLASKKKSTLGDADGTGSRKQEKVFIPFSAPVIFGFV